MGIVGKVIKKKASKLLADLGRVKITGNVKTDQKKMKKQYEKNGYKVPKKLAEGRATEKDINRYMNTLVNRLSNKNAKETQSPEERMLTTLNNTLKKRREILKKAFTGYSPEVQEGVITGKRIVTSKGNSHIFSKSTNKTLEQLDTIAEREGVSVMEVMKRQIEVTKKANTDLQKELVTSGNYLIDKYKEIAENEGIVLDEKSLLALKRDFDNLDLLGKRTLAKIIDAKLENSYYSVYKNELTQRDGFGLVLEIRGDLQKVHKTKLRNRAQII